MDSWEQGIRFGLGLALMSGIPVVALFLLGYWLRGRSETTWTAKASGNLGLVPGGGAAGKLEHPIRPHCWQVHNCQAEKRISCPAYEKRYLPCWLANQLAHGELKRECSNCPLYDLRKAA